MGIFQGVRAKCVKSYMLTHVSVDTSTSLDLFRYFEVQVVWQRDAGGFLVSLYGALWCEGTHQRPPPSAPTWPALAVLLPHDIFSPESNEAFMAAALK